jgi:hypothetical protein
MPCSEKENNMETENKNPETPETQAEQIARLEALVAAAQKDVEEATPEEKKQRAKKIGRAIGRGTAYGFGFLGRGTILLARGLANGTTGAVRGIRDEYRRQQDDGFSKE